RLMPRLLISCAINSPVVIGVVHPVILLPAGFEKIYPDRQRRMMLAHELAHLVRCDLAWGYLSALAEALFFFHPLVWLAKVENRLAQEIACDELAVDRLNVRRAEYAAMLVQVVSHISRSQP